MKGGSCLVQSVVYSNVPLHRRAHGEMKRISRNRHGRPGREREVRAKIWRKCGEIGTGFVCVIVLYGVVDPLRINAAAVDDR